MATGTTMTWNVRHEGSPKAVEGLTLDQVIEGLRDGAWEFTDEVKGPGERAWTPIDEHPQLAEVVQELEQPPHRMYDDATTIDMNALIDVCLVLLIFFILTAVHVTIIQKIVPLPSAAINPETGTKTYTQKQVQRYMVTVRATGEAGKDPKIYVEDKLADVYDSKAKQVDVDKLSAIILPYVQSQPEKTELLLDAQGISWGDFIAIQDAAKSAGVRQVHHLKK